ncbi:MAG: EAL domain-containing protein [Methylococcaceae bacterium]|nr:EAL domain-containing protein [Methylococcaceae bacterium]
MDEGFHADFHGFVIDGEQGLSFAGKPVNMHPKELGVLLLLVRNAGRRVSKEDLISTVWKGVATSDESIARSISVIKAHLRHASPGAENLIKTEYGLGYRFLGQIGKPASYVNEENFFMLINVSPNFIALKNGEGRWQIVNRFGLELYGLNDKPWQGKTNAQLAEISDTCYRESFEWNRLSDEEVWQSGQAQRFTETMLLCGGCKKRIFDITKTPIYNLDGSRRALVVFGEEVTDRLEADRQLRLANLVLTQSDEAILISDAGNHIVFVNDAFTRITGYTLAEVIGQNPRILASGRQSQEFYAEMWQSLLNEGSWRGEIWDKRKNGEIYPKWLNISCVHDDRGAICNYVGIFTDISKRKANEALKTFLVYHDPLTKLPNRLLLKDRFDQAVGLASRGNNGMVALLFLDIGQLNSINDRFGHRVGDRLLVAVAKRLQSCVRDVDTISRVGGDEFVMVLTDITTFNAVSLVAQKVLDRLAEAFEIDEYRPTISTSLGIALYPSDSTDFDTLLKLADTALYHAKDCGRNTYRFYTERMNVDAMERLHMRKALDQAINNNEFLLHYQPQFDLRNGQLLGVEALIRWNKPGAGLLMPAKFISIAEETGQIVAIGEWVIREACRQTRDWQQQGYTPARVAVNLSTLQFKRGDVIEVITDLAHEAGLDPEWLDLELTESIMLHDVNTIFDVVEHLKSLSFTLSIDDFGTGYSCLTHLKRYKVDKLKIDQSFVRNMEVDRHDVAIIHAIIQLAKGLDLRTIAEGVETVGQLELLRAEGCDEAQGYYFSHPLPADEIVRFMRKT